MIFGRKKEKIEEAKPTEAAPAEPARAIAPAGDAAAYQAVIRPHQTEKAGLAAEFNKYVFRVAPGVNKLAVKQAVEKLYKVRVSKVAMARRPAKLRRLGRQTGRQPGFKKAIVTLRPGNKLELQ